MNKYIKEYTAKVSALILALVMSVPVPVFAVGSNEPTHTYDATTSIMGINGESIDTSLYQSKGLNEKKTLLESGVIFDEINDFIIEKSSTISTIDSELKIKLAIKSKTNLDEVSEEKLRASFAVTSNSNLTNIKVDKVTSLDETGAETEAKFNEARPGLFADSKNINTLAVTTAKPQYGMVYYLTAKVNEDALAKLDDKENTPTFAIDMVLADGDEIYSNRYAVSLDNKESGKSAIEETLEEPADLIEVASPNLVKGTYTPEARNIFQTTPASITWTDYVLAGEGVAYNYTFDLDQNQNTENSEINIEYFEATDKGFVLKNDLSQKLAYQKEISLQIPSGHLARIELTTTVPTDTSVKDYSFNKTRIANPIYIEEKEKSDDKTAGDDESEEGPSLNGEGSNSSNDIIADQSEQDFSTNPNEDQPQNKKEEQATPSDNKENNESFLLKDDKANSSKNIIADQKDQDFSANPDEDQSQNKKEEQATPSDNKENNESFLLKDDKANSSKNIIADQKDQDFSANSKSENQPSAIDLNKDSLILTYEEENKLDDKTEAIITNIASTLELLNNNEITEEDFQNEITEIAKWNKLQAKELEEILTSLLAGLNKDKYPVANLDLEKTLENVSADLEAFYAQFGSYDFADTEEVAEEREKVAPVVAGPEASEPPIDKSTNDEEVEVEAGAPLWDDVEVDGGASNSAFHGKKHKIYTEITLSPAAGPVQSYQQIHIKLSEFLTVNNPSSIQPLRSGSYVATPSYNKATNTITYTLNRDVPQRTKFTINQDVDFNPDKIPSFAEFIDVRNSVRGLGMLNSGFLPTIRYDKNGKIIGGDNVTQGPSRTRSYPYDVTYYSHQFYDPYSDTINWDIRIHTEDLLDAQVDFGSLGLAIYAPETQGLENYEVEISDYPTRKMTDGMFYNRKIQSGFLTGNEPNSGSVLYSEQMNKRTGALVTYNKVLNKNNVPEILYIHVEATPGNNSPKYNNYDLGIRITPSVNYINKLYQEFKTEAERLQVAPFTITYIEGADLAEKFRDGFNVIDTRLPVKNVLIRDDKYEATSYADKSRSIFGRYNNNNVDYLFTDTLRLQDDTSRLGNDALFRDNAKLNNMGNSDPDVEVLIPNTDGTYSIKTFNRASDTNMGEKLRTQLGNKNGPNLKPGTIINYKYNSLKPTNNDYTPTEFVSNKISQRYDDGVGYYGDIVAKATLRHLTNNEISENRHRVIWVNRELYDDGSVPMKSDYQINQDGSIGRIIQYEPENINGMMIFETNEIAYCINAAVFGPMQQEVADRVYSKKIENINGQQYSSLVSNKIALRDQEKLINEVRKLFLVIDDYEFNKISYQKANHDGMYGEITPNELKYEVTQIMIYRLIDRYASGYGSHGNQEAAHLKTTYMNFNNANMANAILKIVNDVDSKLQSKVVSDAELKELVQIDGYETIVHNRNSVTDRGVQNVITARIKNPVKFTKVDKDNNPLRGIEFEILKENGTPATSIGTNTPIKWTTDGQPKEIVLNPGNYILREVNSRDYKKLSDTKFTISEINIGKTFVTTDSVVKNSPRYYDKIENKVRYIFGNVLNNDIDEDGNKLVIETDGLMTLQAKNIKKDDKPKFGEFNVYKTNSHKEKLNDATFTLTSKTDPSKIWTKRFGNNGYYSFTDIPVGLYTLTETKQPTGHIMPLNNEWDVELYVSGEVVKTRAKQSGTSRWTDIQNGQAYTIENEKEQPKFGRFDLQKYETGTTNPVNNVTFTLYRGNAVQDEKTTGQSGKITFKDIPAGYTYTLRETSAPDKYEKSDKVWTVEVDVDGNVLIDGEPINNISSVSVLNNNQAYNIGNNGSGKTSIKDLGNNMFRIDTTLTGFTKGGSLTKNNNIIANGPSHVSSYYPQWHFLHMDNYGKTFYDGDQAKSDFYIILNSEKDAGKITDKTTLDLQTSNLNIIDMKMVNVGHNNKSQTKTDIDTFRSNPENLWSDIGGWTQQLNTGGISVLNESATNRRTIVMNPSRFGPNGDYVFLLKISADVIDVNKPTGLNVNWYYQDAPQQDMWKNEAKNNMTMESIGPSYISTAGTNSLVGTLIHNINSDFRVVDNTFNQFTINQGDGSIIKSTIVEYTGSSTGKVYPLNNISFNTGSWWNNTTIEQNRLPYINIPDANSGNGELIVYNKSKEVFGEFSIYKTASDTNGPLDGASFQLYYKDGKTPYGNPKTTDSTGILKWDALPVDTYILKETSTKEGYKTSDNEWTIEVVDKGDGTSYTRIKVNNGSFSNLARGSSISIVNEKIKKGKFEIVKYANSINSLSPKLAGAEFKLFNDQEATEETFIKDVKTSVTTDSNGYALFENLPTGTYYLKETKAPEGYVLGSTVWKVEVSEFQVNITSTSTDNRFKITNSITEQTPTKLEVANIKPTYPATGGNGPKFAFALIGTALMIMGIAYYGLYLSQSSRRKRRFA